MKLAIPLGLMLNELATNAMKHGFQPDSEPCFTVKMLPVSENHEYSLSISNNGYPFPDYIDIYDNETLGLRLVTALAEQIGGTLELKKVPHTLFVLHFQTGDGTLPVS